MKSGAVSPDSTAENAEKLRARVRMGSRRMDFMNSTFHGMLEGQELDSMAGPTHSGNELSESEKIDF